MIDPKSYQLLRSEEELEWFYENVMPPLNNHEVYFLSLSARKKLLTDFEKQTIQLGRTEMFERRIVRTKEWNRLYRTVRKFEANWGAYTSKRGSNIPNHAIVVYVNINPSDVLKAYKEFNQTMNEYMYELVQCAAEKRSTDNILYRIKKQDTLLMNCYQKNRGTKHWMDFDFDIPRSPKILSILYLFVEEIKEHKGKAYIVETQGGYHILVSMDTEFNQQFNPPVLTKKYGEAIARYISQGACAKIENLGYEVIHNKNAMIPLPGTVHNGTLVKILNKE